MRQGLNKLLVFFLTLFVPELAHASAIYKYRPDLSPSSLITFAFEGVVTSSNKEALFPIGQNLTGQYSFDPSVDDLNAPNPEQGVYDAIRGFSFVSGTYAANATPSNSANSGGDIIINRNTGFDPQTYSVFVMRGMDQDRWGPDVDGEQLVRMWLKLEGGSQQPIDSTDIPLNAPDLSAFDSAMFGLFFELDPTSFDNAGVKFSVTSLTTVPLPAGFVLFVSGLVILTRFRRTRV